MDNRQEGGSEGAAQKTGQDVRAAARAGSEQVKAGIGEAMEHGKEATSRLTTALINAKSKIGESTVAGAKITDRTIREHPYESIGIAFGIGVLLGVLINRK